MKKNIDVRALVVNDKNQILLVLERGGPKTMLNGKCFEKPSRWGLPGGRGEDVDEDEIAVVKREVSEETGIWVDINPRMRIERIREDHLKVVLLGYPAAGEIKVNPEEILDCQWFSRGVLYDEKFDMYATHRGMAKELLRKANRGGGGRRWE